VNTCHSSVSAQDRLTDLYWNSSFGSARGSAQNRTVWLLSPAGAAALLESAGIGGAVPG